MTRPAGRTVKLRRPSTAIVFGAAWAKELEAAPVTAANDGSRAARRKPLPRDPREFDRKPKSWMPPMLELPDHTSESMLSVRRELLNISRAEAAQLLRVARTTPWLWESGQRAAPFSAFLALRLLAEANAERATIMSPMALQATADMPDLRELPQEGRFVNRRQRANDLQQRMLKFAAIYNAAALLRDAWHGPGLRRRDYAWRFARALAHELQRTTDHEALLYAVADSLYCSPLGVPWEA